MFSALANFIRGYLTLAVTGFSAERFLNLAAMRGVGLWDIRREGGALLLRCSVRDFRSLRNCSKKSGCKIRIVGKRGLPFILHRYRRRMFLPLGLAAFVAAVCWLTSFVWLVTVEGVSRADEKMIIEKLAEYGVAPGKPKRGVDLRETERGLMADFPEIAWVNLALKGTKASLKVVETVPPSAPPDSGGPRDIVAAGDGVVVSVATEAGRPLVRPGDVVKEGDTLVTGELKAGSDDIGYTSYYVRAVSKVTAKRYYEFVFDIPLTYTIKSFTGNVVRSYGIILFNKKTYLKNAVCGYESYDRAVTEKRLNLGRDYPLPASLFTETYREFIPTVVRRSLEEAEIMSGVIVNGRVKRELPEGAEILGTDITYSLNEDVMTDTALVASQEDIGRGRELSKPEGAD